MKKTVVITGGTRGIGLGMAKEFYREGTTLLSQEQAIKALEKAWNDIGENKM